MKPRMTAVQLRPAELADTHVAHLYMDCVDAEARLRGASKLAAAAVYQARENALTSLWARLHTLDADLCHELRDAVRDWHDIAVKMRGGD